MHEVELATCSFGQGFNVTMVQMAAAYSSILNGGNYYEPHVVKKITDEEGNTIKEVTPVLARKTVSEETADYIKECLRYVVVKGTASGYRVLRKSFPEAPENILARLSAVHPSQVPGFYCM